MKNSEGRTEKGNALARARARQINLELEATDARNLQLYLEEEIPTPLLDTPWSVASIEPYRTRCIVEEPEHILTNFAREIGDWTPERLLLLRTHRAPNIYCLRCPAAVLRQLHESTVERSAQVAYGDAAAAATENVVRVLCGDVDLRLEMKPGNMLVVEAKSSIPANSRIFDAQLRLEDGSVGASFRVNSSSAKVLELDRAISLKLITFVELSEDVP